METNEVGSRRRVLRAYGAVSLLQLCLGICLIVTGLLALRYTDDDIDMTRPPYFICVFIVGVLIICGGICTAYLYLTDSPLIDFYFLEECRVKRLHDAVIANTVTSTFAFLCCLPGIFICVVYTIGPCERPTWLAKCSFHSNRVQHEVVAICATALLCLSMFVSFYSSLMSCVHGWVYDFDVIKIKPNSSNRRKKSNTEPPETGRPVSMAGFKQVGMFDIEENESREEEPMHNAHKYRSNATSSFKQTDQHKRYSNEANMADHHDNIRRQHFPPQQNAPNYVAVLNDPAMKMKLQERRLHDTGTDC